MMDWMLMPFRRYAEFSGRSRRKEYWMFVLFIFLIYMAFGILMGVLGAGALMGISGGSSGAMAAMGGGALIVGGLFAIFALAILIPSIAVAVRRLHDTDRTGWWFLLPFAGYPLSIIGAASESAAIAMLGSLVTIVLAIVVIVFYCLDGTPGPNRYGPDPKLRGDMGAAPVSY